MSYDFELDSITLFIYWQYIQLTCPTCKAHKQMVSGKYKPDIQDTGTTPPCFLHPLAMESNQSPGLWPPIAGDVSVSFYFIQHNGKHDGNSNRGLHRKWISNVPKWQKWPSLSCKFWSFSMMVDLGTRSIFDVIFLFEWQYRQKVTCVSNKSGKIFMSF